MVAVRKHLPNRNTGRDTPMPDPPSPDGYGGQASLRQGYDLASHFRDANTGAGQDFTGLAAAVQLRLHVAIGLQTLTVKSRLLTGENTVQFRGNPPSLKGKRQKDGG